MTIRRRDVALLGGIVALIYGLRALPWAQVFGDAPAFAEIKGLHPFRRLATQGAASAPDFALLGLETPSEDGFIRRARAEAVKANLCLALFGPDLPVGVVPIAYFSEFRCPYCRALERDLERMLEEDPATFRLIQHELPIFGPTSELAARASVAASRQGKQQELRRRFMRTPLVADDASIMRIAADLGLDHDQLLRDMASSEVQAELDRTRALADIFGFVGTPGLVIGRTVLNGAIPYAVLRQIAEDEKSAAGTLC